MASFHLLHPSHRAWAMGLAVANSISGSSVITGQPFESHSKNSSRKALFSCDWIFQEKELCFRFRSWRVSAGGRAPMNYDSFYQTFCAAIKTFPPYTKMIVPRMA